MKRPTIAGVHHLKFNVADLDRSLRFYETALGARRVVEFDHRRPNGDIYAYILVVENLGTMLELRANAEGAAQEKGLDPVTLSVKTRDDLQAWHDWLEAAGVKHSPVFTGAMGWVMAMEDPDGRRIRFYTVETHAFTTDVSSDRYWLGA
jgi:catechol 2,3-dioxygenase-like lactoylglutathione lyase family enzyme